MIISASRRTDIPTYYSDWFFNRIKEQSVLVRNPMNIHQVGRVSLAPDVVDCIVFWTKNPAPMLPRLDELRDYPFYFQFTLNAYGKDVEANLPELVERIDTFLRLSEKIGPERILWRYDPIFLSAVYPLEFHQEQFTSIAKQLRGYTEKCVVSFYDYYPKTKRNMAALETAEMTQQEQRAVAQSLVGIAHDNDLKLVTCSEAIDLADLGIGHGKCIDDKLIERIIGVPLSVDKDKNQRGECGCVSSIDIGLYNTCSNGCKYCYANHSSGFLERNRKEYDADSPMLCSREMEGDVIKDRVMKSLKQPVQQFSFYPDEMK